MSITLAQLQADPTAQINVLVESTLRRVYREADNSAAFGVRRIAWNMNPVMPTTITTRNTTTGAIVATLTKKSSISEVMGTQNSWYLDRHSGYIYLKTSALGTTWRLYSCGANVFRIHDIDNPNSETDYVYTGPAGTYLEQFAIGSGYAYLASRGNFVGIRTLDIDPESGISSVHTLETGWTGIVKIGSYLFVGIDNQNEPPSGNDKVYIASHSLANPAAPAAASDTLLVNEDTSGTTIGNLAAYGNYVCAALSTGFAIVDATDPTNMALSSVVTSGFTSGQNVQLGCIFVYGDYLYRTEYNATEQIGYLHVFDISDPGNPAREAKIAVGGPAYGVYVSGNYAYVGTGSGLSIIDISDLNNPSVSVFTQGGGPGIPDQTAKALVYSNGLLFAHPSNEGSSTINIHSSLSRSSLIEQSNDLTQETEGLLGVGQGYMESAGAPGTHAAITDEVWVDWPLRVDVLGQAFTIGGEEVQFGPLLSRAPETDRSIPMLEGVSSSSVGSLELVADSDLIWEVFSNHQIQGRPVTVKLGGKIGNDSVAYADLGVLFTGYLNDPQHTPNTPNMNLGLVDNALIQRATIGPSETPYQGIPSAILTSIFAASSPVLTAPTLATNVDGGSTDLVDVIDYYCSVTPLNKASVLDYIKLFSRLGLIVYTKRDGTTFFDWFRAPHSPASPAFDVTDWDATNFSMQLDYSKLATSIRVLLNSGSKGAASVKAGSESDAEKIRFEDDRFTSGWTKTNFGGGTANVWHRIFDMKVTTVMQHVSASTHQPLAATGSVNACNADDLSFYWGACTSTNGGTDNRTSGVNILYINPPSGTDPNTQEYIVTHEVQKNRDTTTTITVGGTTKNSNDECIVTSSSARALALIGTNIEREVSTPINKKQGADDFAADHLAIISKPMMIATYRTNRLEASALELNDVFRVTIEGNQHYFRIVRLRENWHDRTIEITGWSSHPGSV